MPDSARHPGKDQSQVQTQGKAQVQAQKGLKRTWQPDGWDSSFKLGLVSPHADIGPEAEAQAILARCNVTVHGARVDFAAMHPGGHIDEQIGHDPVLDFVHPTVLDPVVSSISSAPLDAIGLAFTSSSFKVGPAGEAEILRRLEARSHGIRLITTGLAAVSAMKHLGAENVLVMAPSWFDSELCRLGTEYFREFGIPVIATTASGPTGGPLAISGKSMADAIQREIGRTGAETVFVAGNGQRAVGVIDHLEAQTGVTVLTANQVLVWSALDGTEHRAAISGYGRLFTSAQREVRETVSQ